MNGEELNSASNLLQSKTGNIPEEILQCWCTSEVITKREFLSTKSSLTEAFANSGDKYLIKNHECKFYLGIAEVINIAEKYLSYGTPPNL